MTEAQVQVVGRDEPLEVRINGDAPTFTLGTDRIEATARAPLAPDLLDLLEIATVVFAADGSVTRGGKTRPGMGAGWRRQFEFRIPVRRPDLWSQTDVLDALTEAVGFLTEDDVAFRLEQAPIEPPLREPYFDFGEDEAAFQADEVILFSGGLDSFAGALDYLSTHSSNVILLSHRSAQKIIPRQVELGRYLKNRFPGRVLHLNVTARRSGPESRDFDQRSRSFLFAALGQAVAQQFGASRVSFYENGIVSHNLPMSRQIVGTMATRTTHPLALTLLNRLVRLIGPKPVPIENRFQWLTKAEVVRRIEENGAQDQIKRAVSCTSVREQDSLQTHCGACTQCLDRRFAMLATGLEDHDPSEIYQTDVLLGKRETTVSRTMATEWLRHSIRLCDLDQGGLLGNFGQELGWIARGHAGQPPADVMQKTLDMHHRHSRTVRSALEQAIRDQASQLTDGSLPATSLLRLHLGDGSDGASALETDPRVSRQKNLPDQVDDIEDAMEDQDFDPDSPLVVDFIRDGDRHVVAVRNLGRVEGKPAIVPHALLPQLQEDRANEVPPEKCRFRLPGNVSGLTHLEKATVRTYIHRCRKALASDFMAIHGHEPPDHLLIQGKQAEGYRLDPHIRIARIDPPE